MWRSMRAADSHPHATSRPSRITLVSRRAQCCVGAPARRLQRRPRTARHGRRCDVPSVDIGFPSGRPARSQTDSAGTRRLTQRRRFHVQTTIACFCDGCRAGGVQHARRIGKSDHEPDDAGEQPGRPGREPIGFGHRVDGAEHGPERIAGRFLSQRSSHERPPSQSGSGVVSLCPAWS